ncbi:hypothetical protein BDK51DRAFT_38517 [Blyttiomyces helicus]|uniref:Uncharacterized protein n=1 Tax=Blyttiomyces helicus TaxID=388810 RepID=A0A4P9W4K7_9FUNG|nr:hypothetical protein BDK51DRAFT_38517 [Blyttiomyces helicus]|eukprot:RKO87289.1 hypothetical protein BDK51DRAFT_38517 [Blyttiomyces helicus]
MQRSSVAPSLSVRTDPSSSCSSSSSSSELASSSSSDFSSSTASLSSSSSGSSSSSFDDTPLTTEAGQPGSSRTRNAVVLYQLTEGRGSYGAVPKVGIKCREGGLPAPPGSKTRDREGGREKDQQKRAHVDKGAGNFSSASSRRENCPQARETRRCFPRVSKRAMVTEEIEDQSNVYLILEYAPKCDHYHHLINDPNGRIPENESCFLF